MNLVAKALVIFALSVASIVRTEPQTITKPCSNPLAAGFVDNDDLFWSGPWLFQVRDGKTSPLPWIGKRLADKSDHYRPPGGTAPMHFDDGRAGVLRIELGECKPGEVCAPNGCCFAPSESQWLVATDTTGKPVFRTHYWAAYEIVDVVPIDLVDGPGDEIVIVRTWAHASPSVGYAADIWKIGGARPIDLGRVVVAEWITTVDPATAWRANLTVDLASRKPRTIEIHHQFGVEDCRPVPPQDRAHADRIRRTSSLVFDAAAKTYVER